jgi:hypothetical protein
MKHKVIRRDARGQLYLDYARDDDDPCGDIRDVLRDGESLRVPMYLRDSVPPWHAHFAAEDAARRRGTNDPLVIDTSTQATVVDAFGGIEGLNRPGARYLVADHRTTDHARLEKAAQLRDEAYRAYDAEAQNAWRGNNNLECTPTNGSLTQDAIEQAYLDYDREMAEAWRKAR